MVYLRNYSIRNNRLKKACLTGMNLHENGVLSFEQKEENKSFFLGSIDSAKDDTMWGRMRFQLQKEENQVCVIHAFATNNKEFLRKDVLTSTNDFLLDKDNAISNKRALFEASGEITFTNQEDVLLYDLKGRYLWIFIEVQGTGTGSLSHMQVILPGDNFMNTFPEVYREQGSFFHRYMSIFSSIYNDFQTDIDHVSDYLNIDLAPAELLPIFAGWLGVDVSGDFLEEKRLREFVKEIYQLNRIKGTRQVLERLTEIVLGEKATIVEKNIVADNIHEIEDKKINTLYGKTPYDVTMLVGKYVDEKKKSQLFFLLKQFIPIRCRLHIIYLQENGVLDSYCYLDVNAKVYENSQSSLDKHQNLDSHMILQ